jgi:nitrite reductase (NO-forming)
MLRITSAVAIVFAIVATPCKVGAQPKDVMDKGAKVYNEYCKTCHQDKGQGLGTVYPPLAKSDWLQKTKKDDVIKAVVKGLNGKIKVNGKEYNGVMAPLPAKYTAEEVAAVITYVYNSFGNKGPTVTAAEVKKVDAKRK